MSLVETFLDQYLNQELKLALLPSADDQSLFDLIYQLKIKSQDLLIVLEELVINAKEHGDGLPQFYHGKNEPDFTFLISDRGVGIHERVPVNPRLSDTKGKSSSSIIRLALEEGITGTGTIGRGMGLYYLSRFVRQTQATALIASDRGCVIQQGDVFHEKDLSKDIQSTVIVLVVHAAEVGA